MSVWKAAVLTAHTRIGTVLALLQRFVTHIDDGAIGALTKWYGKNLPKAGDKDAAVLDICSSWISHYPKDYSAGKVSGLGMNEEELARNPVLTDFSVVDLNENPEYFDATASVGENSPVNTAVGDPFTASDQDFGDVLSYR